MRGSLRIARSMERELLSKQMEIIIQGIFLKTIKTKKVYIIILPKTK
jgi:hypothetical protein